MKGPGGAQSPSAKEPQSQEAMDLLPSLKMLTEDLREEIKGGKIKITMQARGLVISFTEAALFPPGADSIAPENFSSIQKVASAISKLSNSVRLEGHTDSVPIHNGRFRDNWDLSAARGIALLSLLTGRFGIPQAKLSVAAYAETAPVASNDSEEGRARNRRVDIIILNDVGQRAEPLTHGKSGR